MLQQKRNHVVVFGYVVDGTMERGVGIYLKLTLPIRLSPSIFYAGIFCMVLLVTVDHVAGHNGERSFAGTIYFSTLFEQLLHKIHI